MLNRTYPEQICSIARALEVVGERWTLLVVRDCFLGLSRFDQFVESLGIARNTLNDRLRLLVEEGVLERRSANGGSGRHEYVLTRKGRELAPAIIQLMKWGDAHYSPEEGVPRLTLHRGCGGEVDQHMRCRRCSETVSFSDLDLAEGPALERARSAGAAAR